MAQQAPPSSPQQFSALVPAAADSAAPRPAVRRVVRQQIPQDLLDDPELAAAVKVLPANYNFEVCLYSTNMSSSRAPRKQPG